MIIQDLGIITGLDVRAFTHLHDLKVTKASLEGGMDCIETEVLQPMEHLIIRRYHGQKKEDD